MIISDRADKDKSLFENLLKNSYLEINQSAQNNSSYFLKRTPTEFEHDVFSAIRDSAKGTEFDESIQLVSGHKFPDIVIKKYYGVEVKTTKQDHWKSTGNSVLETTRIDNVDRIYLFFARLTNPVGFKYRRYEECLYDVAVTHSPRYLIDMNLDKGKTIFDKIGCHYDELRNLKNPAKPLINYYRSIAKRGEEPWWMDAEKTSEALLKPTVTIWSNLSKEQKIALKNEAMARFPEIFGHSGTKYHRLASWLAARHGVVDSSLRDRFTAGGKISIELQNRRYKKLPRIFQHLKDNLPQVIAIVGKINSEEIRYHWDLSTEPSQDKKLDLWVNKIISYAGEILPESDEFITHLLSIHLGKASSSHRLKKAITKYGFKLD